MKILQVLVFSVLMSHVAFATTWIVNGDDTADFTTIQAAIDASSDGDEIIVMQGTYTATGDWVVNLDGKEIWLHSSDGASTTFIDGEGIRRVMYCNSGETNSTIIEGFTIANGGVGGMYCTSSPIIRFCIFSNNSIIGNGGGVHISGSPIIENCSFVGNTASSGGGGVFLNTNTKGSPTLTNCTFSKNNATNGGALSIGNCDPSISNCSFLGNSASLSGGGVSVNSNSNPTLLNCTFTSNTSEMGGGLDNGDTCTSTLKFCTFYDNSATGEWKGGGAIANNSGHIDIMNCIFKGGSASYYGGGVWIFHGTGSFWSCTFEENSATEGGGMYNRNSTVELSECSFYDNTATVDNFASGGGAIANLFGSITMTSCLLNYNHATFGSGGGMYNLGTVDTTLMSSCTVTNNNALYRGGGLYCSSSDLTIANCTFENNVAKWFEGDGIFFWANCLLKYVGVNNVDEVYFYPWVSSNNQLEFSTDSFCDITGDVTTPYGGSVLFDVNDLLADEMLRASGQLQLYGGLGVTNDTGSLANAESEDIIPLALAGTLSGNFSSVTLPAMPEGLGLQLIEYSATRDVGTVIAVKVIEVVDVNFATEFTGVLDSPPVDMESFDADGDGRDEIVILFDGTPGGVACFSISDDGTLTMIEGYSSTVGNNPVDLDVADINGDGFDDVVVSNGTSNTISVLTTSYNSSDGTLTFNSEDVTDLGEMTTCITIIDWDGTAGLDVVVGIDNADSTLQDGYQVLLDVAGSDSTGPWIAIPNYYDAQLETVFPDPPTCVDGGDCTDSWGFVGGTTYGRVHRMESSDILLVLQEIAGRVTTIEAVNLGGDAEIDLMVSSGETQLLYLFQGSSAEADGFENCVPVATSEPIVDVVAIDADFDGDIDIMICAPDSANSTLTLLRNDSGSAGATFMPLGSTWSKQEVDSNESLDNIVGFGLEDKGEDDDWKDVAGAGDNATFTEDGTGVIELTKFLGNESNCDSDLNDDENVNLLDLLILIDEWGATNSSADLNGDGIVNIHDLLMLVAAWGSCD